jgi:hypothetical protein
MSDLDMSDLERCTIFDFASDARSRNTELGSLKRARNPQSAP